jgi:U3 small nucleolar ribonucleoprotein component
MDKTSEMNIFVVDGLYSYIVWWVMKRALDYLYSNL